MEKQTGVYMLLCGDGSLYTGWTNDLGRRLREHSAGRGGKYTASHRPVRLVYFEPLADRCAALRREAAIKRLPRAEKLELLRSEANAAPSFFSENKLQS